jgi:hypothetical protein
MEVERKIEARSHNCCYIGNAITITYSVCVFIALVIQHAMRVRRIMLSTLARRTLHYFFTLSYIEQD